MNVAHGRPHLVVAHAEVGHLQAAPAGLALSQGEVPCGADDLAHARVAEQVGVDGGGLADPPVTRRAEG